MLAGVFFTQEKGQEHSHARQSVHQHGIEAGTGNADVGGHKSSGGRQGWESTKERST